SGAFVLHRFPSYIWVPADGGSLWGLGSGEDYGIKIGPEPVMSDSAGIDPEEMDRYIHLDTDIDALTARVAKAFPGLDPRPAKAITCMVTDSADGQFLVGRLPGQPQIVVAGGDRGPGFNLAAGHEWCAGSQHITHH